MNPADLPLRDIHLPEPIGWWPPAPGWWMITILSFILLIGFALWLRKYLKRQKHWRLALQHLQAIQAQHQHEPDAQQTVKALSELLRRTAMSYATRQQVASLVGYDWLDYLNEVASPSQSNHKPHFDQDMGDLLITAPYQPVVAQEDKVNRLIELCKDWVVLAHKQHPLKREAQHAGI